MDKDGLSILPATNITPLSSDPELKDAVPGMVRDLESSTGSLDEVEERTLLLEDEDEKAKTTEDRIEGDIGEEEVEQVADFASSVLAAISCWRYKAKALLFDQITTVRLSVTHCWQPPPYLSNICCTPTLSSACAPTVLLLECADA